MSSADTLQTEQIRRALLALSRVVREMTPSGAQTIPQTPSRFNLLARPYFKTCRICSLPSHMSINITKSSSCRTALLSLIGFWEDTAELVKLLYHDSKRFRGAVQASKPSYEMRLDGATQVQGDMETVIVNRVTGNWLKFMAYFARVKAKANVILGEGDLARLECVSGVLNDFLLKGETLSILFEKSTAKEVDEP